MRGVIFLSYASQDHERARAIALALAGGEVPVWWDRELSAGQRFEQIIKDRLSEATCVVVLWSRYSVDSDWVKDEANEGKRRNILVPALIDEVPIPYGFGQIHTANLSRWIGAQDDAQLIKLRAAVTDLVRANTRGAGSSEPRTNESRPSRAGAEKPDRPRSGVTRLFVTFTWCLLLIGAALWISLHVRRPATVGIAFGDALSFNTGWVYSGVYDRSRAVYLEGSFATVAYRPGAGERGAILPIIGDVLKIVKDRRVIIANFKIDNVKYQMISPPLVHNILTDADETGEILKKNMLVTVRDVEISGDPGRSDTIWCRVAVCDKDTDGCVRAAAEELGR